MKKILLATALLSCAATAFADDPDRPQADRLEPVVVTATRSTMPADRTLAAVTVITREEIERLQPQSVQDLLTGLPGVAFANAGGIGQQTSMFLRGTNSSHTLVLVDGVRIGTAGAGIPAYEQLPVEQIERIEIVRGPRSSLYGSDAIGGVIQIFTRHGSTDRGLTPSMSLTAGSHDLAAGQFGLSGGTAHAWYNASLGGQYTGGINACQTGALAANAGCFADEPDRDASRTYNGALSGGYRWDDGTELTATWLRSKGDIEYDGSFQNFTRRSQQVAGAKLAFGVLDAWRMSIGAGQNLDRADNYLDGALYGVHMQRSGFLYSRRNQASWQNDFTLTPDQQLSVGVDYQQERLDSDTAYLKDTRADTGIFAFYQGQFGSHDIQLSARHDHNQQFGNHDTGSAAYGYRFEDGLKITASYGTAFHAPTFNDLYFPFGSGNPDLRPETSRSAEIGLSAGQGPWQWSVNAYQTRIDDLIALDPSFFPVNVDQARIRGIEGQLGTDSGGWHVRGYLTLQQPENVGDGTDEGDRLARRPRHSARIDLDRDLGPFTVGGTLYGAGNTYDDAANAQRLGGYGTLDLRGSWRFRPDWSVQARLANAFDHDYRTARFFNQTGRTFAVTLRYAPAAP
jgi:vitamin B12 transporter